MRYIKWYEYLWLWMFKTRYSVDMSKDEDYFVAIGYKKVFGNTYIVSETVYK